MKNIEISEKTFSLDSALAVLQILTGSLLIALFAQIQIPLYFTPVPLSGQTFGVMLVGGLLGARKGLFSVAAYLLEGTLGLPVFAGMHFGLGALFGTTGGYFLGFFLQAGLVGRLCESQEKLSIYKIASVLSLACGMQLSLGALWLSRFVGLENAFALGIAPFIAGEALKILSLSVLLNTGIIKNL